MIPRRLLPNMPALLAFDALARTGGFTAAARALGQTQGAVSRQIAQLEGQLGVALIDRTARGARLTEAGAAYARAARAALDTLGQGAMEALGQSGEHALHLAILPTFGTRWLMPRLPRFLRRHPEITLHLTTRIGRFDLTAEGVDAAIHAGPGDWPGMRLTLLMDERVLPVAAPGTAEIAGQPLLALATRPQAWAGYWGAQGLPLPPPAPTMQLEQVATLAQAAAAGMGVALVPAFLMRPELDAGTLVALGPERPTGVGYFLAEPAGRSKPAVARLRDWLLTETDRDTLV